VIAVCGLLAASGCSLIYNPDNLPAPADAPIDMPFDADPSMPALVRVAPTTLFEGQGDGSRRAILVIHGRNLVVDGTTVSITAHAGEVLTPSITVDNSAIVASIDHEMLAVPVALPVDVDVEAGQSIRLDVTVSQLANGELETVTLDALAEDAPVLTLQGLSQLTGVNVVLDPTATPMMFSKVDITGNLTTASGEPDAIRIRATSTLSIVGGVTVDAVTTQGGAGGGAGGTGGAGGIVGGDPGTKGGGPAGGQPSGGVGGYAGDDQLTTLAPASLDRGSGGAGGDGSELLGRGGNGGGGGGTVDLSAGGNITVGPISAKGASGEDVGGNDGGAGSGGTVLLRSDGGSVTVTGGGITVTGGTGPGTAGAVGRSRIDGETIVSSTPGFRGPTFAAATPLIVTTARPTLTIFGEPQQTISYSFNNEDGSSAAGPFTSLIPNNGKANIMLAGDLFPGANELCVVVHGALSNSDTRNCIELAFLPGS